MAVRAVPVARPPARRAGRAAAADALPERDDWLAHCEGYRVDSEAGRIGFVEEVRVSGSPEDAVLAVRAGRLGRRLLLIPASQAAFAVPHAQRIWLRPSPTILGTEPAASR